MCIGMKYIDMMAYTQINLKTSITSRSLLRVFRENYFAIIFFKLVRSTKKMLRRPDSEGRIYSLKK